MTRPTDHRTFATEIAATFLADEDRAYTIHRAGQLTVAADRALDRVEPWEVATSLARVKTSPAPKAFEALGLCDGWLVRTEIPGALLRYRWATRFFAVPYLRLIDELTGYAQPQYTRTNPPTERDR
jgi:hypothetical protein